MNILVSLCFLFWGKKIHEETVPLYKETPTKIRNSSPIYFSGRRIMALKLQSHRQGIFYKEIGALSHINSSVSLL